VGAVTVVPLDSAEPIELPQGSWSRMLVTGARVDGNASSLGYSVFTPGTVLTPVKHETEEVAYVVAGSGELRLGGEAVPFREGDAVHIPAGTWHAVANNGETDVIMVFGFPHPEYPPTERA
jgi:quercetin dioxygenase-like cupin family protein